METQEKLIARARLIASGIIRYYKLETAKEVDQSLGILAEELSQIEAEEEVSAIRRILERYGLRVPELSSTVHADQQHDHEITRPRGDSEASPLCSGLTKVYNQDAPVHGATAVNAQDQQKSSAVQIRNICRTYRNIYSQVIEPEASTLQHLPGGLDSNSPVNIADFSEIHQRINPRRSTGSWTWRNWSYNRVPPAIEEAVRERFEQGWSKSKLAREFRLNRRTIIRICASKPGTSELI